MAVAVGGAVISAVAAAIGTTVAITGVMSIVAGIIGGAIIGAAVGGLTAAITGGSIGKGMLFGAIGGAVTGGIGAWLSGPTTAGMTTSISASENAAAGTISAGSGGSAGVVGAAAGTSKEGSGALSGLFKDSTSGLMQGAGSAVINLAGNAVSGSAQEDMMNEKMKAEREEAAKNRELQMKLQEMASGTQSSIAALQADTSKSNAQLQYKLGREQLDEQTRQFNVQKQMTDEMRQRQTSAVEQAIAGRKGVLKGNPSSIDQQITQQEKALYPTIDQQIQRNLNDTVDPRQVA